MDLNVSENSSKLDNFIGKIKKNFKIIIVFVSILLLIFLFLLYQREAKEKQAIKISNEFNVARLLIEKGEPNDAKEIFYQIIDKKNKFYSPLSLYLIIENNMEENKDKLVSFDKIIKIKGLEKENKNLIKIKKALFLIEKMLMNKKY